MLKLTMPNCKLLIKKCYNFVRSTRTTLKTKRLSCQSPILSFLENLRRGLNVVKKTFFFVTDAPDNLTTW